MRLRPIEVGTMQATIRVEECIDITFRVVSERESTFTLNETSRVRVEGRGSAHLEQRKDYGDALKLAYKTVRMARQEAESPTEGRTPESFRFAIMVRFYKEAEGIPYKNAIERAVREMDIPAEKADDIVRQAGAILKERDEAFKRMFLPDPAPPRPDISPTKARFLAIAATPGTVKQFLLPKRKLRERDADPRQGDMFGGPQK